MTKKMLLIKFNRQEMNLLFNELKILQVYDII